MKKALMYMIMAGFLQACHNPIDEMKIINQITAPSTDVMRDFANQFEALHGTVDPQLSWMTAANAVAEVDMSDLPKEQDYYVHFYTADPRQGLSYCFLLAEYKVKGGATLNLEYDYPIALDNVFVTAISESGISYTTRIDTRVEEAGSVLFDKELAEETDLTFEPMRYRICYEGFTGEPSLDFDFNDVVAEIEYVRGNTVAKVNVLAAGCECASQLSYKRSTTKKDELGDVLFEEVHDALGFPGWFDHGIKQMTYPILNTGMNQTGQIGTTTLNLNEDAGKSITEIAPNLIAGFSLPSDKKGKKENITSSSIPVYKGVSYPQAILVAYPDWEWPKEYIRLSVAYSKFRLWMANPQDYANWYGGKDWKTANDAVN